MSDRAGPIGDFRTIDINVAGRMIALADLPEYRKFYEKLGSGLWEPHTFETLSRYLDRDTVLIDIGAWIGVTPFFGAEIAKSVVAVDPDPKCIAILQRLAKGQDKVMVLEGALSNAPSVSIHAVEGFGSSETSVLDIGDGECVATRGLPLEDIIELTAGAPAFAKIDIEGYEFLIGDELARLADFPVKAVQIAIHPRLFEKSLSGSPVSRRLSAAWATWKLARRFRKHFSGPRLVKYPGLVTYILFGIVFRATPRGADFLFEQRVRSPEKPDEYRRVYRSFDHPDGPGCRLADPVLAGRR